MEFPDVLASNQATLYGVLLAGALIFLGLLMRPKSKNLPPVVRTIPVIGGLLKFLNGPVQMAREEYDRLGPVFTCKVLTRNITFLIGPEVSENFFKAPEAEMSQKEVYKFNVPTFGPDVVFAVDYPIRVEQYRFFMEALKVSRLKGYVDAMVEEAQEFTAKWGDEGEVDLKAELEHLIILTASRCLLGIEVRRHLFGEVSELIYDLDQGMVPISVLFPYLPIAVHRKRDKARKRLEEIFGGVIEKRKKSGVQENDMLQSFIDSKYKADGRPTTHSECTGLLIAALFGGQHTSSITSSWMGAYLMNKPSVLAQAQQEQLEMIKKHGEELNHDVICNMDYLARIMKETLRMHPPLVMLLRYAHKDFDVECNGKTYTVPKGHVTAVSPSVAGRLPLVYPNPDNFDPDRYIPGREEDKKAGAFSYIPFGGGRHGCLGETFAYMQIRTIYSVMLRNFEFELVGDFPEVEWNALVVGPKGPIKTKYRRRKLSQADVKTDLLPQSTL
ncbi:sterol 14alpha-demethylase [Marchantia polymorpha subsp. ruderalis]|uniref:sterol 14alpha-demethylase n=2 Tax=Marchantia polymorpha TaxID=3197 RepID=A0A176VPB2_MARPO|nr:hypothetical protein AXG93_2035s1310 [Marchantia polymorpha subsp. ruderalis]PTQ49317.1 hypothetical protein MARPO_0003s0192 [Marchantia polymorpha]BBN17082.1 hypothetical protein Mp_7g11810 [Marchantia polymorpha subsp. ruderalis]|eukprot:PTQ49317.1 hypothetical protein MARPO_0003s0192 [Marchantia polymorpha]